MRGIALKADAFRITLVARGGGGDVNGGERHGDANVAHDRAGFEDALGSYEEPEIAVGVGGGCGGMGVLAAEDAPAFGA